MGKICSFVKMADTLNADIWDNRNLTVRLEQLSQLLLYIPYAGRLGRLGHKLGENFENRHLSLRVYGKKIQTILQP
jgi:hypothetical protein